MTILKFRKMIIAIVCIFEGRFIQMAQSYFNLGQKHIFKTESEKTNQDNSTHVILYPMYLFERPYCLYIIFTEVAFRVKSKEILLDCSSQQVEQIELPAPLVPFYYFPCDQIRKILNCLAEHR